VPQCNKDVFPDKRNSEGEYLEAERKLFYVSMTRASRHLVLSWVATKKHGTREAQEASEFLIEAGIVRPTKRPAKPVPTPDRRTSGPDRPATAVAPWKSRATTAPAASSAAPKRPPRLLTLITPRTRLVVDGIDAVKIADVPTRILAEQERMRLDQMTIRYQAHDPDATLPLQLALALHGIPYTIAAEHRLANASLFRHLRQAKASREKLVAGSFAADTLACLEKISARAAKANGQVDAGLPDDTGGDPDGVQFVAG
jgi:hypothetical protein